MSVDDDAKAVTRDAFLLRDLSREIQHLSEELRRCLQQGRNALLWDDEQMHRSLGLVVPNDICVIRLRDPLILGYGLKWAWPRVKFGELLVSDRFNRSDGHREERSAQGAEDVSHVV
jgi:hypothetical protein